jgi:hypothetical protein
VEDTASVIPLRLKSEGNHSQGPGGALPAVPYVGQDRALAEARASDALATAAVSRG